MRGVMIACLVVAFPVAMFISARLFSALDNRIDQWWQYRKYRRGR